MKSLVVILGMILCAGLLPGSSGQDNPGLTVIGEGTVTVPADTVNIAVSAQSRNSNQTLAEEEAQETLDRTVEALLAAGVRRDQILSGQSSGRSSFQSQSRVCRTVNNTTVCDNASYDVTTLEKGAIVRLQTTDQARIDEVLKAARSQGAEASVIGYGISDLTSASAEARKAAVENARMNAQSMAAAAGGRLGRVLDISDYTYPDISSASAFGYESSRPGMADVTAIVMVTYELTA